MRSAGGRAAIGILVSLTTGCGVILPYVPPCPEVRGSAVRSSLYLLGPPSSQRTIALRLYQEGIELQLVPWTVECATLSERQTGLWLEEIATVERDLREVESRNGSEYVLIYDGDLSLVGAVMPADLTPESIEALRGLTCSARDVFGRVATREILQTTPELAELIGFPGECEEP